MPGMPSEESHAKRSSERLPAFLYWEDVGPRPAYIDLCLSSLRQHLNPTFEVAFLGPENICDWSRHHALFRQVSAFARPGGRGPKSARSVAIFTGMLRTELIAEHGGLWIDADTIALPNIAALADLVSHYDFIGTEYGTWVSNALVGGRRGSQWWQEAVDRMLERIATKLQSAEHDVSWGEFGFRHLSHVFDRRGAAGTFVLPFEYLYPFYWDSRRSAFDDGTRFSDFVPPFALAVTLNNNGIDESIRRRTSADLLAASTVFAGAVAAAQIGQGSGHPLHSAINRAPHLHAARAQEYALRERIRELSGKLKARNELIVRLRKQRDAGLANR